MKKTLLVCIVAFFVATIVAVPVYAATFQTGESVSVQSPVSDDLYIAGQNVIVSQDVTGDLYVAGLSVQINGNVSGDLTVAAQTITVNGSVGDDAKLVGQTISLNGSVGDDLMTASSDVNISALSKIGGSVYTFSDKANVNGTIMNDLDIAANSLSLTAQVGGNAEIRSGTALSISDTAKVSGNLNYTAPQESQIPAGVVTGETNYTSNFVPETGKEDGEEHDGRGMRGIAENFAGQVFKFLGLLFIGFILLLGLPYSFKTVAETTKLSPLKAFWYGLLFIVAIPVISFLLLFTIIGIKFAGILMVMWLIMWPFGKIYGSYYFMRLIIKPSKEVKFWRELGVLALGLLVLVFVHMLPFVGWLVWWTVTFFGLGGLLLMKLKVLEMLKGKKMV